MDLFGDNIQKLEISVWEIYAEKGYPIIWRTKGKVRFVGGEKSIQVPFTEAQ